jgi:hypothetical protein
MKRRGGFTAAELMVVMAMIGFATAILSVVFHGANGRARTVSCLSNVCELGLSARMYMQDNDGWMPALPSPERPDYEPPDYYAPPGMASGMDEELPMSDGPRIGGWEICGALMVYVKNQQVFRCPDATRHEKPPEYETQAQWNGSRGWYQVDYIFNLSARGDDPPTTILVSDDVPDRHPGRTWNGVRVDGAAVRMRADRWDDFWGSGPCGDW